MRKAYELAWANTALFWYVFWVSSTSCKCISYTCSFDILLKNELFWYKHKLFTVFQMSEILPLLWCKMITQYNFISYWPGVVKPKKSEKSWQALVVQVFKTMVVWRAVSKQTLLNLWKYLKFSHDYWKFVKILSALPETSVYGLWMTLHFSSLWRSGLFFWCPLRCVHCVVKNKVQLFWIHYI